MDREGEEREEREEREEPLSSRAPLSFDRKEQRL
jgi:hypothetical protein